MTFFVHEKMRACVWMWILSDFCVMRLTTISKLPWRGPHDTTHVCEITHSAFFSFIRKLYWNKQAAVAAHNKFAQYFFSHSPPIFSFQKRNKQQPSERFFRSTVIVSVYAYIRMGETIRFRWLLLCVWDFFYVVVVGWCHLKFFFDIIFVWLCDRSQKCELDRNSHICDDIAKKAKNSMHDKVD